MEWNEKSRKPQGIIRIENWFCTHVSQILNVTSLIKMHRKKELCTQNKNVRMYTHTNPYAHLNTLLQSHPILIHVWIDKKNYILKQNQWRRDAATTNSKNNANEICIDKNWYLLSVWCIWAHAVRATEGVSFYRKLSVYIHYMFVCEGARPGSNENSESYLALFSSFFYTCTHSIVAHSIFLDYPKQQWRIKEKYTK